MQSTQSLDLAKAVAARAHFGQTDKAGVPYIGHLENVANQLNSEDEKTVAYLHDIIEDTDTTAEDLIALFSADVVDAVIAITKSPGMSYSDYLKGVKENRLARKVKLADLTHNMMISRIKNPTDKDYQRIAKYKEAFRYLSECEETL